LEPLVSERLIDASTPTTATNMASGTAKAASNLGLICRNTGYLSWYLGAFAY